MSALALRDSLASLPEALRRYVPAWLLVGLMVALFTAASASLLLYGAGPGFDSALANVRLPDRQTLALRREAAQMSATQLKQVNPFDAIAINAAIPVSSATNPAARPFVLTGSAADRARSLECMTAAIYYEAALEPTDGQRAVAQVILNRVRHPAYPSTVCGVVFEGARRYTGCQFSFTCDGSLRRAPMASIWDRVRAVARAALDGYVHAPVGWSTHYHANYVVPYWASRLVKSATIGAHIFYRWRGGWGRSPAFVSRYAGIEPVIHWRGGFGQPSAAERLAAQDAIDAAAAAAAGGAPPIGSVDSFQRAVLRRYEPLRRDTANALIAERARADGNLSSAQRWALTGRDEQANTPQQRRLGRWAVIPEETPASAATPPPAVQQPSPGQASTSDTTSSGQ
ncbi:MAG: cell wall hydrolase [Sphingosinicella sp.]